MAPAASAIRLGPGDEQLQGEVKALLATQEDLYPGIVPWFCARVLPQVGGPRRHVWAIHSGGALAGEAVLKLGGGRAKLCSLFLDPRIRGGGVAAELLSHIVGAARRGGAGEIHFSMGEDTAALYVSYFERIGFAFSRFRPEYRRGVRELVYSAAPARVDAALAAYVRERQPPGRRGDPARSWMVDLPSGSARRLERPADLFTAGPR